MTCVVVTGASRGIGLELCKQYLSLGYTVFAVCRQASQALRELPVGLHIVEGVDVTDDEGIRALTHALANRPVEILINNAGIFENNNVGEIDFSSIERQFLVNAVAPLHVTEALLPNLSKGSKVALITSRMGSMADNSSGAYYGYRMSKAALNAAGVSLARDLLPRGIAVALLHPGFVQTKMVGFAGDISPLVAAERLVKRIEGLTLENSGSFWHSNGELLPW